MHHESRIYIFDKYLIKYSSLSEESGAINTRVWFFILMNSYMLIKNWFHSKYFIFAINISKTNKPD